MLYFYTVLISFCVYTLLFRKKHCRILSEIMSKLSIIVTKKVAMLKGELLNNVVFGAARKYF